MILGRVLATPDLLISRAGHLWMIRWIRPTLPVIGTLCTVDVTIPSARQPVSTDSVLQPRSGTTTVLALPDNPLHLREERDMGELQ